MSMGVIDNDYREPIHPNTRKCSSDGIHMNKSFIDEIQNTVEKIAMDQYKSGPIHLTLQRIIFNDPHDWEIQFVDIVHSRIFIVTHFFSNQYYTKDLISSLDDQSYTISAYTFDFETHVSDFNNEENE